MSGFSDTSRTGLASLSFVGLLATQFLVALNDNMFRWLVMPIGKVLLVAPGVSAEAAQNAALAWGSVCFLLPFVLLAAPAGYLANRFSKRSVMIGCKVAEIVLMFLAVAAILSGNFYLMLGAGPAGLAGGSLQPGKARRYPGDCRPGSDRRGQRDDRHDHDGGHHPRQPGRRIPVQLDHVA